MNIRRGICRLAIIAVVGAAPALAAGFGDAHQELAAARGATAGYHDVATAVADGYVDIGLYVPGMGHHYLNPDLLGDGFDPAAPELLVYANAASGGLRLVAVEYAVVITDAQPPSGFTGSADHWHADPAGLWTLHAWVWLHNPDGTFAAFNPRLD